MSSSTLTCQSHLSIPSSNQDFSSIINTICQSYRLTGKKIDFNIFSIVFLILVVEKINSAASLYAETILGNPVALLFKLTVCKCFYYILIISFI
jgi:predicted enzyme involved in methoxymalonyl-ACP biosynthesis